MAQATEAKPAATGRRKTATARVTLSQGTGKFTVNGRAFENYFPNEALRIVIVQPLKETESLETYDICASVSGGGLSGQAGAVQHGLARALIIADPALRGQLKKAGFLRRDARMKERKKPGQPGARKRFQFSKR